MKIHPTAVVSEKAELGKDVKIGPYAVIEDYAVIGDGSFVDAHAKIASYTSLGKNCRVYMGALVGEEPQDHRFKPGLKSSTEIGDNTVIREYVTIHRPPFENKKTSIGHNCLFMAFVHIAHDDIIGNHVTIANHTALTGHVEIGDGAVISGYVMVHQFCRIGSLAMVGPDSIIRQDIPPFCLLGENSSIFGPNVIGLRRAGLDVDTRSAIRKAIKTYFFKNLNTKMAVEKIESMKMPQKEVKKFVEFIKNSQRGIMPGNIKKNS